MVRKSENDSRNQFCKNCNDILIFFRFSTFKQISDKCNGGPNEKNVVSIFRISWMRIRPTEYKRRQLDTGLSKSQSRSCRNMFMKNIAELQNLASLGDLHMVINR